MSSGLPRPVRKVLDEIELDEGQLTRAAASIEARMDGLEIRRVRDQRIKRAIAPLAMVAAVLIAVFVSSSATAELRLADGRAIPAQIESSGRWTFSDGSILELEDHTRLELIANDADAFALLLIEGRIRLEIPPDTRSWTIECGAFSAKVSDSTTRIERNSERTTLTVERGNAIVYGESIRDRVERLDAGQSFVVRAGAIVSSAPDSRLRASDDEQRSALEEQRTALEHESLGALEDEALRVLEDEGASVPYEMPAPASASHAIGSSTPRSIRRQRNSDAQQNPGVQQNLDTEPRWRRASREGAYADAYRALGAPGLRRAMRNASVEELMELADVARLSGHPREAVEPLTRILDAHSAHPSVGLAAFALGRLEDDVLHRSSRARRAFERALRAELPPVLRVAALARIALSWKRSHEDAEARAWARRAFEADPNGAFAPQMRTILSDGAASEDGRE